MSCSSGLFFPIYTRFYSIMQESHHPTAVKNHPAHLFRLIPVILTMGMIFFLSHFPGDDLPGGFYGLDKIAHMGVYGLLAATALFAVKPSWREHAQSLTGLGVVLFCIAYGISDEYHQSFIPGRTTSGYDLLADTAGALMLVGLWRRTNRRTEK
ncbi:VanZ family protein [Thermodesulfobacteriota bacterium]